MISRITAMLSRTTRNNVLMLVTAFFLPLFATTASSLIELMINAVFITLLGGYYVHLVTHQLHHPQWLAWINHPTKPRDFIFNALTEFLSMTVVLTPCLYLIIAYLEQDIDMYHSLFALNCHIWSVWFVIYAASVYRKRIDY